MTDWQQYAVTYRQFSGSGYLLPPTDFGASFGLLYAEKGNARVYLGGEGVDLCQGQAVVLPENMMLFAHADTFARLQMLACPTAVLRAMMQLLDSDLFTLFLLQARMRPYVLTEEDSAYGEATSAMSMAVVECQAKEPCYLLMMHAQTGRLLAALLRQYAAEKTENDRLLYHNLSRMTEVIRYMETHADQKLSLSDLSEKMQLSPDYFSRLLYSCTGKTAKQYIQAIRLNEALRLLAVTDLSVGEIAKRVGYSSTNFFGTLFLRTLSMTPTAYRQICQN